MTCSRIAFFGTPDFAASSLMALLDGGENVVAVYTQPDRPRGRNRKLAAPPVKILAESCGIPVFQPDSVRRDSFLEHLSSLELDLVVVAAYGKIIPEEALSVPTHGFINVHASLLPHYRGASPIQCAVLNGDAESGITIMQMNAGLDTGDILIQHRCAIGGRTTAADLHDELALVGGEALADYLCALRSGTLSPRVQDDAQASYAPLMTKADGEVRWDLPAEEVFNRVRGLFPWPGAYTFHAGKRIRLYPLDSASAKETEGGPGEILVAADGRIIVACGRGSVELGGLQLEGRKAMEPEAFLQGYPLSAGDRLGERGEQ